MIFTSLSRRLDMLQISFRLPSLRDPTLAFCKIITIKTRKKQQKKNLCSIYIIIFQFPFIQIVFPLI